MVRFLYTKLIKPILFRFDPERVHEWVLVFGHWVGRVSLLRWLARTLFVYKHESLKQTVAGIMFPNPVGLSAGFDKDAHLVDALGAVGFGFAQIGTVTNKPYAGNEKPRLRRLINSRGILVNYGLKNSGVERIIKKIKKAQHADIPLSISIGRTNSADTADRAPGIVDIVACLEKVIVSGVGDFYTINISCPNLFGGESFAEPEALTQLLKKVYELPIEKPIFIKMPINLAWEVFKPLLDVCASFGVDGVIIGNLNKDRSDPSIQDTIRNNEKGSVSGLPTQMLSNQLISATYKHYGDKLLIIGVGGVFSAEDAYEKIARGASLVQVITGLIYEGPQLVKEINKGLVRLLERDDYSNVSEAIGKEYKK